MRRDGDAAALRRVAVAPVSSQARTCTRSDHSDEAPSYRCRTDYFGNPHSTVPDNLMSYERTPGADVFLDARQVSIIRAKARRVLATREVAAVVPEGAATTPP